MKPKAMEPAAVGKPNLEDVLVMGIGKILGRFKAVIVTAGYPPRTGVVKHDGRVVFYHKHYNAWLYIPEEQQADEECK